MNENMNEIELADKLRWAWIEATAPNQGALLWPHLGDFDKAGYLAVARRAIELLTPDVISLRNTLDSTLNALDAENSKNAVLTEKLKQTIEDYRNIEGELQKLLKRHAEVCADEDSVIRNQSEKLEKAAAYIEGLEQDLSFYKEATDAAIGDADFYRAEVQPKDTLFFQADFESVDVDIALATRDYLERKFPDNKIVILHSGINFHGHAKI